MKRVREFSIWLHSKGFFSLLSANFLTQLLGFGSTLLVAKLLTPEKIGEIRILQTYTSFFSIFAMFGISMAVLKFCSENRPICERQSFLKQSLLFVTFSSIIIVVVFAILSRLGVITNSKYLSTWLIIYSFTIPLTNITSLIMTYLQALKQINKMAIVQTIIRIQTFIIIIFCTWKWGFEGFIYATLAAYVLGLVPLFRQVGGQFWKVPHVPLPNKFMNIAWFTLLGGVVSALGQYADVFLLDHFTTNRTEIGYYSLALTFLTAAMLVTGTVQSIIVPHFSERAKDEIWVRSQLKYNQIRMTLLSLVVGIGVFGLAWLVMTILYDISYKPMLTYLSILLLKYVIWSGFAIIGGALGGMGLISFGFKISLITTPVGLVLSFFFLRAGGIPGVAWAQVCTALLTLILIFIAAPKELRRFYSKEQNQL